MKTFALYIAAGLVAVNVVGNVAQSAAERIQDRHDATIEAICSIDKASCQVGEG